MVHTCGWQVKLCDTSNMCHSWAHYRWFMTILYLLTLPLPLPQPQLLERIQTVLNAAAWLIFASRRHNHVTPLLRSLHWLRVPERITFRLAVLAYCCLHGSAPAYLASELFAGSRASRQQRLQSSSTTDLAIPRVNHATLGSCAFAASATSAWNSISHGTHTSPSLTTFRSRLKMFQRSYA